MSSNATTLTELLIRERPALLRLVRQILGADGGADDVIQGVWFKVRGVGSEPVIGNPRAYLYRLASNLATDHGRERTRRLRLQAENYLWGPDEVLSTEEQVMAQDELARVLEAAEHLPEQRFKLGQHALFPKIALNKRHTGDFIHRQDIQRKHAPAPAGQLCRHLRPAARCAAQISQHRAGLD